MAGKFYGVVLRDGRTGMFGTWPDAQAFIRTCPSSAKYKGFPTEQEAADFVTSVSGLTKPGVPADVPSGASTCVAYVDGSFEKRSGVWGYGVVLYPEDDPDGKTELSGSGKAFAEHRNVTGEVYGAMVAVREAIKRGFRSVTIYHDYTGIADWVTGAWQANNDMTQKYAAWMRTKMSRIDIKFVKVDGHTGVELNERCDVLAKTAAGVI